MCGVLYSRGFPYVGVQFGSECYCSDSLPTRPKLDANKCTTLCHGNAGQYCGGTLALSVYHSDAQQPAYINPDTDASRPLVCLSMIVKNEAHTILTTLMAVKVHRDGICA